MSCWTPNIRHIQKNSYSESYQTAEQLPKGGPRALSLESFEMRWSKCLTTPLENNPTLAEDTQDDLIDLSHPSQGHKMRMETLTRHPAAGRSGLPSGLYSNISGGGPCSNSHQGEKSPLRRLVSKDAPNKNLKNTLKGGPGCVSADIGLTCNVLPGFWFTRWISMFQL